MNSKAFSFDKENAQHVFHVFLWTVGSAFATLAIALLAGVDVPDQYVFMVPLVNTALVALKEWMTEQAR